MSNERTEGLTSDQMASLLSAIDSHPDIQSANFMLVALYTGMRKSELFRLKWADVDYDRGFIHIRTPKGGKDQIIPLNETVNTILQGHPKKDSEFTMYSFLFWRFSLVRYLLSEYPHHRQ